ncbi:hypothetical protein AHF37_08022 [Paragonimus kellicotti]|nr:hypothetical protein AHF37_08022 [Paragonimus kellicotti]
MFNRGACRFWNMCRNPLRHHIKQRSIQCYSGEEGSTMSTGALHDRPHITPFGAIKVVAIVSATIFCGAMITHRSKVLSDPQVARQKEPEAARGNLEAVGHVPSPPADGSRDTFSD